MSEKPTYKELEQRVNELEKENMKYLREEADALGFGQIIERSLNEIYTFDSKTLKFMQVNKGAKQNLGYSMEELQNLTPLDLEPEFTLQSFSKLTEPLSIGEKDVVVFQTVHKRKDGSVYPVEAHLQLIKIKQRPTFLAIILDITERKYMDEVKRRSERKYRFLAENVADIVWTTDLEFKTTYASPSIERLLGFTLEERKQQTLEEILTPESIQKCREVLFDFLQQEEKGLLDPEQYITIDVEYYRKDGSTIWMENSMKIVRNPGNQVIGLLGVSRDLTERKHAEMVLRESEERFRTVAEQSPNMIFINKDGRVVYHNEQCEDMMGYEREEFYFPDFNFLSLIAPESLKLVESSFNKHLNGIEVEPLEYTLLRKDGSRINTMISTRLIENNGEKAILGVITDITKAKNLEEQLRQAHKMESIGTLAGGIAHDFNNILTIIVGNLEVIEAKISDQPQVENNIKNIIDASFRAKDVVGQLLSFARTSKDNQMPLGINYIVKESLRFLRAAIPSSIEIRQNVRYESGTIMGDPTQINQLLINLCTNSAHAMKIDGGILVVNLTGVEIDKKNSYQFPDLYPGHYVKLTVKDNGSGIDPAIVDKIFDPFFTTKPYGKGTGLGLSVVHGIVKNHGGIILVDSEPGIGTTVDVYFPKIEKLQTKVIEKKEENYSGKERILIVDDETIILEMSTFALEKLGYQVTTASNPLEALELFKAHPDAFDLVITDMTMPHITGDKLTEKLISIRPNIPVIICTGYNSAGLSDEKIENIGARTLIMKPYRGDQLGATVREVLDNQ